MGARSWIQRARYLHEGVFATEHVHLTCIEAVAWPWK